MFWIQKEKKRSEKKSQKSFAWTKKTEFIIKINRFLVMKMFEKTEKKTKWKKLKKNE